MVIIGVGLDMVELPRVERVLIRFGTHFLDRIMSDREQVALPGGVTYRRTPAEVPLAEMPAAGEIPAEKEPAGEVVPPSPRTVAWVAARFAAKEATVKALGTGFSEGITPCEIEVRSTPSGKPELVLHGNAAKKAECLGVRTFHLTLTHTRDNAAAVVILEG